MSDASPLGLLERMFEAEFAYMKSRDRDVGHLSQSFHPDVVIREPESLPYAGEWRGLSAAGRLFEAMADTWSDLQVQGLTAARSDDIVFMTCELTLTARATGRVVHQPFAEVLVFRDDRLLLGTPFYFDTAAMLAAIAS